MRHNALRNIEGELLRNVCKDVKIEPQLIPNQNENAGSNAEGARLDISAIGLWSSYERTFFDVRVTHPTAISHIKKPLPYLYIENENPNVRE